MRTVADVTTDLRRRLAAGEWQVGERLPTFAQLSAQYPVLANVYRTREALAPLIHEGILSSTHGSGTYVRRLPNQTVTMLDELLNDLDALRGKVAAQRDAISRHP